MPFQHSPPARQIRSQAFLTPTPRSPLDGTPEVPQLRAQLDRGPHMEGEVQSRKEGRGPRRSNSFSGVEESDGTAGVPAPVRASQDFGGPTLAQSYKAFSHQSEASLLVIMQQMTQIMANIQADSSSELLSACENDRQIP
ncbi:hypothetical protein O181_031154 [Austropuccinia psidii MF-1]|uniref:Uncharacterized protein n=1 Tax=Austropuccinia psidii MF-1 TaxID=1389203 RepID=A0A9Q3H690_9BASI|nr:hypothetical protein [Austropuccinia psidii MF-1]